MNLTKLTTTPLRTHGRTHTHSTAQHNTTRTTFNQRTHANGVRDRCPFYTIHTMVHLNLLCWPSYKRRGVDDFRCSNVTARHNAAPSGAGSPGSAYIPRTMYTSPCTHLRLALRSRLMCWWQRRGHSNPDWQSFPSTVVYRPLQHKPRGG